MAITKKHTRKLAAILEVADGTYLAPNVLLPFTSSGAKQGFSMIADESVLGVAFKGLPSQGVHKAEGSIEVQADLATLPVILGACMGAQAGGVHTCPTTGNAKSVSLCSLDGVKTNKYAGVHLTKFNFSSEAEGGVKISADMVGNVLETRDDTAFPTISVSPSTALRLLHQHLGGASGYFRIGDQADALAAGDNLTTVKSVQIGVDWGFDFDYVNSRYSLIPQSKRGEVSLSVTLAEHSADTFLAWRDARTTLQLSAYFYVASGKTLLIEIPNIVLSEASITEDDKAKQELVFEVARNGIGTAYENANMAFVSPVRFTLVNS